MTDTTGSPTNHQGYDSEQPPAHRAHHNHHHDEHDRHARRSGHAGHSAHHGGHAGHDEHAGHDPEAFRRRFWLSLVATVPLVVTSEMVMEWFGYSLEVPGMRWVGPTFGSFVFWWGGWPFLTSGVDEVRVRRPGMMLLISPTPRPAEAGPRRWPIGSRRCSSTSRPAAAVVTFVTWWRLGDLDDAVVRTVTVLVIACPHALGLAIPLVVSLSTAVLAEAGILVKDR